jgi:hypothetical protein
LEHITVCRTAKRQDLIDERLKRIDASYDAIIDALWLWLWLWLWLSLAIDTPTFLQFLTPALLVIVLSRTGRTNEQLIDLSERYLVPQRDTISAVDLQPPSSVIDWDDDNTYRLFFRSDL